MHDAACLQCLDRAPQVAAKHTEGHLQLNSINSAVELEVEIHHQPLLEFFLLLAFLSLFLFGGLTMRMQ